MDRFDVIVIGMGPGGEVAAGKLLASGKRVAVVEQELIGGECAYWACIPSKTLLRATQVRAEASRVPGVTRPSLDWQEQRAYRDDMVRHLDDTAQVRSYEHHGATVIKGTARFAGPQRVDVDGQLLESDHVIIATGSTSLCPPIDGLDAVTTWTNREATTVRDLPKRVLIVGGSAAGIELGQFYARMGTETTIVQRSERLLDREDRRVSELVQRGLAEDGAMIHTGRTVTRTRPVGDTAVSTLDDGTELRTDVIILAAGRQANTNDLNLASIGLRPDKHGAIPIDDHCRAGDGVWAVGDVTGIAQFTHVAKYQGRVVADNILGHPRRTSYEGIPRVVFADPEIAAVGLTEEQARHQGIDVATSELDLAATQARAAIYERDPTGTLGLVADRTRRILVGAWAVAPLASEWIHQAALGIRAHIPIDVLLDQVAQFPTYTESYLAGLEHLDL
jgi:dihydrolipoamide dehydrogenase